MKNQDQVLWSEFLGKRLLLVALSLGLLTHGIIVYFTLPQTYDAYVRITTPDFGLSPGSTAGTLAF